MPLQTRLEPAIACAVGDWERVAFLAAGAARTWKHVAEDALRRGTWAPLARRTAAGRAALDRARGAGLGLSPELVREAEAAWRYARRLVAAEDLEAWLAARAVTVAEWRRWVQRDLAVRTWPELAESAASSAGEIDDANWVAGWCSGAFEQLARDLAGRVAARLHMVAGGVDLPLDDAFDRFRMEAVTEEAIRSSISSNQLEWLAIEGEWLSFPDEDAASEALALIRDDGLTMEALSETAGAVSQRRRIMVEDVPATIRQRFLSARPGEHVGPIPANDGMAIVAVYAKHLPSPDDEAVRERATATIIARAVDRAIEEQVRWVEPF